MARKKTPQRLVAFNFVAANAVTLDADVERRASTSKFHLRRTRVSDATEIGKAHVAIWKEAYAGVMDRDFLQSLNPGQWVEQWHQHLTGGVYRDSWVATDPMRRHAIVGFVAAGRSLDHPPAADDELYVLNACAAVRGTGVSDLLIGKVLSPASISLWVVEDNDRAVTFYEHRGFVRDGAHRWDPRARTCDIRMVRQGSRP